MGPGRYAIINLYIILLWTAYNGTDLFSTQLETFKSFQPIHLQPLMEHLNCKVPTNT